jgi:hypothetical protein
MTDETAAQVLNDLIQVNTERISRYEKLISDLAPAETELRYLFAKIIGESHQNKIILATELHAMGEAIDLSRDRRGSVYSSTMGVMLHNDVHNNGNRLSFLDHSEACEGAVSKAYDFSLQSHDVADYLRDLLKEHQTRITECRHAIKVLRDQLA